MSKYTRKASALPIILFWPGAWGGRAPGGSFWTASLKRILARQLRTYELSWQRVDYSGDSLEDMAEYALPQLLQAADTAKKLGRQFWVIDYSMGAQVARATFALAASQGKQIFIDRLLEISPCPSGGITRSKLVSLFMAAPYSLIMSLITGQLTVRTAWEARRLFFAGWPKQIQVRREHTVEQLADVIVRHSTRYPEPLWQLGCQLFLDRVRYPRLTAPHHVIVYSRDHDPFTGGLDDLSASSPLSILTVPVRSHGSMLLPSASIELAVKKLVDPWPNPRS